MKRILLTTALVAAAAATNGVANTASAALQEVAACVPSVIGTPCAPGATLASTTGGVLSLPATTVGAFSISGSSEAGNNTTSAFFNSQTLQLSTTGGLIDIYFTVSGVPTQQVPLVFTSTFTSNQQNADTHSVIESTYLNNSNTPFGTSDTLASATLTNAVLQIAGPFTATRAPGNPVSFTELYQVQLQGCSTQSAGECTGNLTIDLSAAQAVPEPGSLAVLGAGLAGLGFIRYRRRRA